MPTDFYGIELFGIIKVPQGDGKTKIEYPLWLGGGDDGTNAGRIPAALADLSYLQDITVQIGLGLNSKSSITLTPTIEEGIDIINSEIINWAGSELEVTVGYSTGTEAVTQAFGGLIMKPEVRIGQDIQITLHAMGVGYGMRLSNATSPRAFPPGTSPAQAVVQTLKAYDLDNIDNEASVFPDFPDENDRSPSTAKNDFFKPYKKRIKEVGSSDGEGTEQNAIIQKSVRNDWWFVRELCKAYNMDLVVRDKTVVIRNMEVWATSKPVYTFVLRGAIDTDARVFPILEFNTPSAYVWLSPGVGGVKQIDLGEDKEKAKVLDVKSSSSSSSDSDSQESEKTTTQVLSLPEGGLFDKPDRRKIFTQKLTLGDDTITELATFGVDLHTVNVPITRIGADGTFGNASGSQNGGDGKMLLPGSPEEEKAAQVINEYKNVNYSRGIIAEVTSIGVPTLLPGDVIYITGLEDSNGKSHFNGAYGVMMVEHNIGTAGMMTKFKALRNFFPNEYSTAIRGKGGTNESTLSDVQSSSSSSTITKIPSGD